MKLFKRRSMGFTMVELLVVLGILVSLAALILPAIGTARESGRRVQCLSNLRTLTAAWLNYATDNAGRFCNSAMGSRLDIRGKPQFFWSWIDRTHPPPPAQLIKYGSYAEYSRKEGMLWPYLKDENLYFCPSFVTVRTYASTSYGINALFASGGASLMKIDDVVQPQKTMAFIEGDTPFVAPTYPSNIFASRPGLNHFGKSDKAEGTGLSFADGHAIFWPYHDWRTGDRWQSAAPNSPDVYQLEAWSGGPVPPGVAQ